MEHVDLLGLLDLKDFRIVDLRRAERMASSSALSPPTNPTVATAVGWSAT
jgi:hypothetical protein